MAQIITFKIKNVTQTTASDDVHTIILPIFGAFTHDLDKLQFNQTVHQVYQVNLRISTEFRSQNTPCRLQISSIASSSLEARVDHTRLDILHGKIPPYIPLCGLAFLICFSSSLWAKKERYLIK